MIRTPVTVFNGFLGSGKTSIILQLIRQLPPNYKAVFLKNEFGDQAVDSQLAKLSNISGVQEILNGCLCCVLVGQLKNAICELMDQYQPDRIFIETSGSAFPAPLAWQVNEMERGNVRPVYLDGIITVIDCINFQGYEDTSYTARLQAQYTDLVVLNKWQLVTERQLDLVLDRVLELNPDTPYIHADCDARVPIDLILGADHTLTSRRFRSVDTEFGSGTRIEHMSEEVDVLKITVLHCDKDRLTVAALSEFLSDKNALPTDRYYRIKGFLRNHIDNTAVIINWAFGRFSISEPFPITDDRQQSQLELTVIGPSGVLFANDMISMEVDKLFSRAFNGSANITKL